MINDKKVIAVVGASSGAGATFVAKRLAVFMAQKCEQKHSDTGGEPPVP